MDPLLGSGACSDPSHCWPIPLLASPSQPLSSHTQGVTHDTMEGPGLTYQTLAGTLSCHMAGNGTWKTLGREEKSLEAGVQEAKS